MKYRILELEKRLERSLRRLGVDLRYDIFSGSFCGRRRLRGLHAEVLVKVDDDLLASYYRRELRTNLGRLFGRYYGTVKKVVLKRNRVVRDVVSSVDKYYLYFVEFRE